MNSIIFRTGIVFFLSSVFSSEVKAQWSRCHWPPSLCTSPYIISQPTAPQPSCPNSGTSSFSIVAGGSGPIVYKWKENGILLSDGGVYSGATSSILTLTNPTASMNGKVYQCLVSNCSNVSVLSNSTVLTIQATATDINQDGITDNQDFSQLNLLYNSSCLNCREDINIDGAIDVKDFLELLGAYNTMCQ